MKSRKETSVLITGGSGFIGFHLTCRLLEQGYRVVVADMSSPKNRLEFVRINVQNQAAVNKLVKRKFSVIFHLAGRSGTTDFNPLIGFKVNCRGAFNLLEAVRHFSPGTRVVFSNSRQEYGKATYLPVDEDHPTEPINHYGLQKLLVTRLALFYHEMYGLDTVVLRTSNVFGKLPKTVPASYNIVSHWLERARQGKKLTVFGKGEQLRDYLYIDDLVEAMMKAGTEKKASGEVLNIGFGGGLSIEKMADIIASTVGGKVQHKAWPKAWFAAETGHYVSDIAKAKRLLKWQPRVSFKEGVKLSQA